MDVDDELAPVSPPFGGTTADLGAWAPHLGDAAPHASPDGAMELDALTGLLTKTSIEAVLRRRSAIASYEALPLSVLLIEFDDDHHGDDAERAQPSDVVLAAVDRLTRTLSEGDTTGRVGARTFLVVRLNGDRTSTDELADRIVGSIRDEPLMPGAGASAVAVGTATMDSTSPSYDGELLVDVARGAMRVAQLHGLARPPRAGFEDAIDGPAPVTELYTERRLAAS